MSCRMNAMVGRSFLSMLYPNTLGSALMIRIASNSLSFKNAMQLRIACSLCVRTAEFRCIIARLAREHTEAGGDSQPLRNEEMEWCFRPL